MTLYAATQNTHKLAEIRAMLPTMEIKPIAGLGQVEELPETGDTLEANARQKARYIYNKFHVNCFADDSGLEVRSLNGAPGVLSARYAGEQKNAGDNTQKLLAAMDGKTDRFACFKTVIALIIAEKEYVFEGVISGSITTQPRGNGGFGYDPVFMPDGYDVTFAEMHADEKNKISHRALAIAKMVDFIKTLNL